MFIGVGITCAYVALLEYLGVQRNGNIPLFLAWNILYVAYLGVIRRVYGSVLEALFVFTVNTAFYLVHTFVVYGVLEKHTSTGLLLYAPGLALVLLPTEFLHFYFFNKDPKQRFLIADMQSWNEIFDFLLAPLIGMAYWLASGGLSYTRPSTPWIYVQALGYMCFFDLVFGVLHCYLHFRAFNLHQKHHVYKRSDLCTYANFYSNFFDGVAMAGPGAAVVFAVSFFHGSYLISIDAIVFAAFFTHNKYGQLYINMVFFYEMDILLDLIGSFKVSNYHRQHHDDLKNNFGVFGFVGDSVTVGIYRFIESAFLSPASKITEDENHGD